MADFKEKLLKQSTGTPYYEAISHVILINNILKSNPSISYSDFSFNYSLYSDEQIMEMDLPSTINSKEELIDSIVCTKNYLNKTAGRIASAQKGLLGSNNVFAEYIDMVEDGFVAWADVLSELEGFAMRI